MKKIFYQIKFIGTELEEEITYIVYFGFIIEQVKNGYYLLLKKFIGELSRGQVEVTI